MIRGLTYPNTYNEDSNFSYGFNGVPILGVGVIDIRVVLYVV